MRVLLDASIDFSTLDKIRELIRQEPSVDEIKSLTGRNAGRFRFIETTITLNVGDLEKAHRISETIETRISRTIPNIEKITIHYEPKIRTHDIVALPLSRRSGHISAHFGEAPYFAILHIHRDTRTTDKQQIIDNPHCAVETAKGLRVAEWLSTQEVTHVGIKEDIAQKGPGYMLSSSGIILSRISSDHMDEAIREIVDTGNWDDDLTGTST